MHKEIADFINQKVPSANAKVNEVEVGDASISIEPKTVKEVCLALRDGELEMNVLQVISGVDYKERIEVNYMLASFTKNSEFILKVALPKESKDAVPEVESVCDVWSAANFQERECYDMVGVRFLNHPDHRRILCPDDWEGFPLRKDYKVQEVYNGMEVNPENKMNHEDHYFYKKVLSEVEDPKKVTFSWKPETTNEGAEA